ncbi:MAG TPA: DUF5666 domain-containing protein [Candidatus Sulfotelmatobacter sp.]|nr:DUF5666 domain-containing protein [Candidatus Sulfotelmatobacter sp.]
MKSKILAVMAVLATAIGIAAAQAAGPSAIAKQIGTIKSINGNAITLTPESGADVPVTVEDGARILKLNPGEKDLKNATPIQLQDLKAGDKVRVRGHAAGQGIDALEVLVITSSAVDAVREQIRQDWQKRGVGGLVSSVDPADGTVTISVTSLSGKKEVTVKTAKNTVIRRYAPDSIKFDDAKPSTLAEIHRGDQLRARGERSADGSEVTAEEIVSGSFKNVAGVVNSVDASAGTINVQDLLTKKPVVVKVTPESQLHQLPPEMAEMIAMRLRKNLPAGTPGAGGARPEAAGNGAPGGQRPAGGETGNGGMGGGMRQGGSRDFQSMLNRMPAVTLSDLHKGDAVLIVATEGSGTGGGTAITLLSGVEPILQAAPSQAMMLTPWSLGGAPGGEGMQ